ncbi:hypothetical protein CSOJ01_13829 [Colletotrichum sojae]|uniref:Uncharacterized protein n=1 Tax=Colletotrichum sojae TaxID=2175907 RepID=A0A8H6ISC6_9PEZI|nr:hypothetical protein CSOJ01_13829 [Colletotrichum sojae]
MFWFSLNGCRLRSDCGDAFYVNRSRLNVWTKIMDIQATFLFAKKPARPPTPNAPGFFPQRSAPGFWAPPETSSVILFVCPLKQSAHEPMGPPLINAFCARQGLAVHETNLREDQTTRYAACQYPGPPKIALYQRRDHVRSFGALLFANTLD